MPRRLDRKLDAIFAGRYTPDDFIIADAKDADMAFGVAAPGPVAGQPTAAGPGRYHTRATYLDHMRALVLVRASDTLPETATESLAAVLRRQAPLFSLDRLAKIAHRLIETEQQLRTGEGTPLPLELALLDLTTSASSPPAPAPKQPAPQAAPAAQPKSASAKAAPSSPEPASRSQAVVDLAQRRAQQATPAASAGTAGPIGAASPGVTEKALNRTTAQLEVELADADVDGLRMRLLQQARTRARRLVLVCWLFSWCVMVGGYRDREAVWHRGQCGQQGGSGV